MIGKGDTTATAILSSDLTWLCGDDALRQYLSQLEKLYSYPVARRMMQVTKEDLEYGGHTVELSQSRDSIISDVIRMNDDIRAFWSNARGWAPTEAAELLARSRLDWQVFLSHCLKNWLERTTTEDHDGRLILAWVNLGCLVEGTLKFFLSVYEGDYSKAPHTYGREKEARNIEDLRFEDLKQYFSKRIWTDPQRRWTNWMGKIQRRRNAVHAYKDPDIGTFEDFFAETEAYLDFLIEIEKQVP